MSTKKGVKISLIHAFRDHPLQIFGSSITVARRDLPNVLAKMLGSILPGDSQPARHGSSPSLDTRTPSSYTTVEPEACVIKRRLRMIHTNWGLGNSSYLAKTEFNNGFIIYLKHEKDIRSCGFNYSKYWPVLFPIFRKSSFSHFQKIFPLAVFSFRIKFLTCFKTFRGCFPWYFFFVFKKRFL
jgi:hypothetical protein